MPNDKIVVGRPAVERPRFVPGRFDFIKKGYFDHSWLPAVMVVAYMFGLSQVHAAGRTSGHDQVPPSSQGNGRPRIWRAIKILCGEARWKRWRKARNWSIPERNIRFPNSLTWQNN